MTSCPFLPHFLPQSRDSELLKELSAVPLCVLQQAESLLGHADKDLLVLWRSSSLRRTVTDHLPRFLNLLQDAALLGQLELKSEFKEGGAYRSARWGSASIKCAVCHEKD